MVSEVRPESPAVSKPEVGCLLIILGLLWGSLEEGRGWYLPMKWKNFVRIPVAEALLYSITTLRHEGERIEAG